jgi:hypothetical protein
MNQNKTELFKEITLRNHFRGRIQKGTLQK